jgi:hypothetical protein
MRRSLFAQLLAFTTLSDPSRLALCTSSVHQIPDVGGMRQLRQNGRRLSVCGESRYLFAGVDEDPTTLSRILPIRANNGL